VRVGELLFRIAEAGITLTCSGIEDRLNAKPTSALTPDLIEEIREHKMEIIQIMREDDEMRRTGIIQSERQVFELARDLHRGRVAVERRMPRNQAGWLSVYGTCYWLQRILLGPRSGQRRQAPPHGL
jgi:hypothetical protein